MTGRTKLLAGMVCLTLAAAAVWAVGSGAIPLGAGSNYPQNTRGIAVDASTAWAALGVSQAGTGEGLKVDHTGTGDVAAFQAAGVDALTIDTDSIARLFGLVSVGGSGDSGIASDAGDLHVDNDVLVDDQLQVGSSLIADADIQAVRDVEHRNLPSVMTASVITSTNGALWTVGTNEIWLVHDVKCHVATNFDCTGDDCALKIGDGNDDDGFLVLADAELQAADTEGTGFEPGWQGMTAATRGAYLEATGGYVYQSTETIDIDLRDASAGTNPTAGAGTCYLFYTRID